MDYALPNRSRAQEELYHEALLGLPFQLTMGQQTALDRLCRFTFDRKPHDVFVLNGYAGTGKTSLMGAYVRAMNKAKHRIVLLAPTGRAAKVFAGFAELPASTIHRRLYRPSTDGSAMRYRLAPNRLTDAVFIVDEASLIGDGADLRSSLLMQLVRYVYSSPGCALVLMGDTAQLPPVGQPRSMAMQEDRLRSMGLNPLSVLLDEPVRQASQSGILVNATRVRRVITGETQAAEMLLSASQFPGEVTVVQGSELEDYYTSSIAEVGHEATTVITRSNWRANLINNEIRYRILDAEEEVGSGERIMITRNNYFWSADRRHPLLANGDMATVLWIGQTEEKYGLRFADAEVLLQGHQAPTAVKLMLSTLDMKSPNLSLREMDMLLNYIAGQDAGVPDIRVEIMDKNPYYNALQIKHAYCITCHKSQGGQWKHVYIDMAGINPDEAGEEFYRWLYTAMTRATERIFLLNPTLNII